MKFRMNNIEYEIKEVSQEDFQEELADDERCYGQTRFLEQLVLIDKDLSYEKKKKTLYHELMHIYIKEFLSNEEIELTEELLCDISANSHDIIHEIVNDYFITRLLPKGR